MEIERTQTIRQRENLQKIFHQARVSLERDLTNDHTKYRELARILSQTFDQDFSKIVQYLQTKLDWPIGLKRFLLYYIREENVNIDDRLNHIANFVFDPRVNRVRTPRFRKFISSIERTYGSAVSSIFNLHYIFFILNILTFIPWLALIILPYSILTPANSSPNISFSFPSIFTGKDYLAQSILFQGNYQDGFMKTSYDLPLIYVLTSYLYYIVWFVFLTIRFASSYKRKIFHSILSARLGVGFTCVFGRWNYMIHSEREKQKYSQILRREFMDLIENDERMKNDPSDQYQTWIYRLKMVSINLIFILFSLILGGINWFILSVCEKESFIDCYGSIIYLVLINRLMPYVIAILTQLEQYQYLSYRLVVVGFRCIFLNICTILSFVIYFFIHAPNCYETVFGQFLYVLLVADLLASLILPLFLGLFFDFISSKTTRVFDGINLHVQISPPVLLYSQFLILLGTYFSPLLPLLVLLNLLLSFISHRLYLWIRSCRSDSFKHVFIWNAYRLENLVYLLAYIVLIVSATAFVVFTTQIKSSGNCGPFRRYDMPSNVIGKFLDQRQLSVLWRSVITFLTSPGLIYFLGVTFVIIVYKLRHEGLAEKQLVFIRENNLESKKHLRQNAVKKLHRQENDIQRELF